MLTLLPLTLAGVLHATPTVRKQAGTWLRRTLAGRTEAEFPGRTLDHEPCTFKIKHDPAGFTLSVDDLGVRYGEAAVEMVGSSYVFEAGKSLVILRLDKHARAVVASAQDAARAVSCVLFQR